MKAEARREEPQVVEVLHPRVRHSQKDHGLELLGDHSLLWIDTQSRGGMAEECGEVGHDRRRGNSISIADVDLQRNASCREVCHQPDPGPLIALKSPDRFDHDRL